MIKLYLLYLMTDTTPKNVSYLIKDVAYSSFTSLNVDETFFL